MAVQDESPKPSSTDGAAAAGGAPAATRAGYIALVGRPNVGKSTLLNALVGEKLSIVTARAQTTRERVTGILTTADAQAVFLDTPGLLEPSYLLQEWMLEAALRALEDADVVLLLLDATRAQELPSADVIARLRAATALVVAINKVDAGPVAAIEELESWSAATLPGATCHRVSAVTGVAMDALLADLVARLPLSPYLFPEDDIAIQPVRFFVAELIRETLFETLREEVPYSTAVQVEEFRESEQPLYIRATIYVERESQKGIVVGSRGAVIREIGSTARGKIESFLDASVYLDLWVKAKPGWRRKKRGLEELGYERQG
ncbi:MAG TPA: GTPase Era [Longimicrobiales bacterium]|nr:GTPase Era [Longimicrobiales bacterium]